MQSAVAEPSQAAARRRPRTSQDLTGLAAPLLELVLKLEAGLVPLTHELRATSEQLLDDFERRATNLRHPERQVQNVKFALAAFIDEAVLTANFPLREQWERDPLQLKYFGEHLAGVKFFDRLGELLKNVEAEADVVEVYYLCLLIGFKGKYKVYMEDQLKGVIDGAAAELRRVGRLQEGDLSPHWRVTDQPEPPLDPGLPLWVKVGGGVGLGALALAYMLLLFLIRSEVNAAREQLLR